MEVNKPVRTITKYVCSRLAIRMSGDPEQEFII